MIKVLMVGGPADGKVLAVEDKYVRAIRVSPLPRIDSFAAQSDRVVVNEMNDTVVYNIEKLAVPDGRAYRIASPAGIDPFAQLINGYRDLRGDGFETIEPSPI